MQEKGNWIFNECFIWCLLLLVGVLGPNDLPGQQSDFPIGYTVNGAKEEVHSLAEVLNWPEKVKQLTIVNDTDRKSVV